MRLNGRVCLFMCGLLLLLCFSCDISPDIILEHVQNNPNYLSGNYSSKQVYEQASKLSCRSSNPKAFMKKYEDMKSRKYAVCFYI